MAIEYSTISPDLGDDDAVTATGEQSSVTLRHSIVAGSCQPGSAVDSQGYNIESPVDTCGFDQTGDQAGVSADGLALQPLSDNGGPTMTRALGEGSVAIDQIPKADCLNADGAPLKTDQRGEPRPAGDGCDVGAFEVQP